MRKARETVKKKRKEITFVDLAAFVGHTYIRRIKILTASLENVLPSESPERSLGNEKTKISVNGVLSTSAYCAAKEKLLMCR